MSLDREALRLDRQCFVADRFARGAHRRRFFDKRRKKCDPIRPQRLSLTDCEAFRLKASFWEWHREGERFYLYRRFLGELLDGRAAACRQNTMRKMRFRRNYREF